MSIKFLKKNSANGSEENIFWVTMADLLLGLAIIFITLFVLAMTGFSQQNIQQQKVQMEVSEKIGQELQKADIKVDMDKMTGDLKISDVELFEPSRNISKGQVCCFYDDTRVVASGYIIK